MSLAIPVTVSLYFGSATLQGLHLRRKLHLPKYCLILIGLLATLIHAWLLYTWIDTHHGQNLDPWNMFSLISWLISVFILLSSITKPLENLTVFILPVAALSIIGVNMFASTTMINTAANLNVLLHILISITSFSILGIAALQAILISLQDKALKKKQNYSVLSLLPPLQTMESLLFQIIWLGFVLLSASLISGYFFFQNTFNQLLLTEKVLLSALAWLVFAVLLAGRHFLGWRSKTAVRWTIIGTLFLALAYFGSKLFL